MEYQTGIRFLQNVLLTSGRCVVPLYRMNPDKAPEFVGSSVYCKHANLQFVFTARHVVQAVWPNKFWYPYSENESRILPCDGFHITKEETDDFCIAELTSNLPAWLPFPYERIDTFSADKQYQHLLIGYPGSFAKKSTRLVQRIKLQGYLTSAAPESEYERLNVNSSKEFIVLFRKEKVFNEKHNYTNFPDPNGMSGGGVFQFNENMPQLIYLVGIMTRWDIDRKNAIIATKFETIKSLFTIQKISRNK